MARRVRTPQDTFLSDQALAAARDQASDGRTLAVVLDYATDGQQCSWCDCPDDPSSPHYQDSYRCDGCPADAYYVASMFNSTVGRRDIPLCRGHLGAFKAHVVHTLTGASG